MNNFDFQVQAIINLIGTDCVLEGLNIISPKGIQRPSDEAIATEAARLETEYYWNDLRAKRNQLLAESDWVSMKAIDASIDGLGIQLPQVWMDYRQALRDLPANTTDPANPDWPVKPGGDS